jgi:4-carboxymuconolactone decarboxylase
LNRPEQLRSHLIKARENGVTQEELIETITRRPFPGALPSPARRAATTSQAGPMQ